MNSIRLALVTRRYWPLVGGAEMMMANLSSQFRAIGSDVQIVTAQWHKTWPKHVVHREVVVQRLPNPPLRGWGTFRYMMSLGRWIRSNSDQLDVVYVSMLKHSAYTTVMRLKGSNVPVVLRAEGAGLTGDCHWQQEANFGSRIRQACKLADAIVAPSEKIYDELLSAGYEPEKVHLIENGVDVPKQRTLADSESAKLALSNVNPALSLTGYSPVAIFTGRLHSGKGLLCAIKAWKQVVSRFPNAKLWIIGEGPQEAELREAIETLNLQGQVIMPGVFDDVDELLQAADLFILPSHEEGMSISLLEAMAVGLPVIATDISGNQKLIEQDQNGLLFPVEDSNELARQVLKILSEQLLASELGVAARESVKTKFSLTQCADKHMQLFQQLISDKK